MRIIIESLMILSTTAWLSPYTSFALPILFTIFYIFKTKAQINHKSFLVSLLFIALFLWLTKFTPATFSKLWDGANHILLIRYLDVHSTPPDSSLSLAWGGELKGYPWFFHGSISSLGKLLGIESVFLIQPLLLLSVTFASLRLTPKEAFLFWISLLPSFTTNQWTQIVSLSMLVCFIRGGSHIWLILSFLYHPIVGALGAVLSPVAFIALFLGSLFYIDEFVRIFSKDGGALVESTLLVLLILALIRPKNKFGYVSIFASCLALLLWVSGATYYWVSKLGYLSTIMILLSQKRLWILALILLLNLRYYPSGRHPSFKTETLKLRDSKCETLYMITDPYTAAWTEALVFPKKVSLLENQPKIAIKCKHKMCDPEIESFAVRNSPNDECIIR